VDVARCPLEVFELVNGLAKRPEVTVVLLHVLNLNILTPENRVYEEHGQEAQWYLESLANKHLHPMASAITHVRVGKPAEEILTEAKAWSVDLIILPTYGPSFWNRLRGLWRNVCVPPISTLA
jgi:nucleotide-binding universal stress UspA family protein